MEGLEGGVAGRGCRDSIAVSPRPYFDFLALARSSALDRADRIPASKPNRWASKDTSGLVGKTPRIMLQYSLHHFFNNIFLVLLENLVENIFDCHHWIRGTNVHNPCNLYACT